MVPQAHQVRTAPLVLMDRVVLLVQTDLLELLEQMVHQVRQELQVVQDLPVHLDPLENLVLLVRMD
jgi:hypothetical protein